MDYVCVPGSSHGGIAMRPGYAIHSDQVYDQQNTVSLLGGSGGEINYFQNAQRGSDLSTNEGCSGNWLIGEKTSKEKLWAHYNYCTLRHTHYDKSGLF